MEKMAILSMGCVQMCSESRAIRILLGKEEMRCDTVYSTDITDLSADEMKEIAGDIMARIERRKIEKKEVI